ncbi:MAG: ABC transporter permease subunit [Finegoldia sp.]|nr:ABC transporter permease subunit [Finegoldia sp.]
MDLHKNNEKITGMEFFKKKRRLALIGIMAIFFISYLAAKMIDFQFFVIFTKFSQAVSRFVQLYLPPNFEEISVLLEGIWVTFILSVSSGMVGSLLAYLAALLMSKKTSSSAIVRTVVRFFATLVRNIPSSIWAIILLLSLWFGEFLAFIVMTLGTFGFNARVFADVFDEASTDSIEALEAVGADRQETIVQSVFPDTWPEIVSWTLYAIETNIRDSTIVGMLAGGGIGQTIEIFRSFRRFDELTAAVILITILVFIFDRLSVFIREKLEV